MNRYVSIIAYLSVALAGILLILLVLNINPNFLRMSLGPLANKDAIIDYETILIWRERSIDTVFQTIAMAGALLGVLALLLKGGEENG
jgi:hypothetical protein